jgi:hypothetical protein
MNTNALHNVINIAIALLGALEFFDWTAFFEPKTALVVVGCLGLLKIMINVVRDGVTGLVKEQPPVVTAPAEIDYSAGR